MKENEEIVIQALTEVEACRRRPGMYCGDTTSETEGASVLLREIIDNATDELSAGYGDTIIISNNYNGGYNLIADNGRGLPIEMNQDVPDKTSAELSFTKFHAGSKFEGTATARVGMNGVGSAAANALSEIYILFSKITDKNWDKSIPVVRDVWSKAGPRSKKDLYYLVVTQKGIKTLETAGRLKDLEKQLGLSGLPEGQSTIVLFKADPEIWTNPKANVPLINLQYFLLIQEKFFGRKLKVIVNGTPLINTFKPYKEEIIRTITPEDTSYNPQVSMYLTLEEEPKMGKIQTYGSVNGLDCGVGFHINLAKSLFKAALKDYYKIKSDDYLLEGLKVGVIMLASEVNFSSQTKENLKSITKVKPGDFNVVIKDIQKLFKKDPQYWDAHAKKVQAIIDSMKNIGAIEKSQKIIAAASGNGMYRMKGDLAEGFCDATAPAGDRWNCELFMCFTGDTEVLIGNERVSFIDLTERISRGEDIYTSSCTPDGEVVPAKIIASKKIKEVDKIIKVTLNNGESFKCTLDHKIMMRDGTYKEAGDLRGGDSMMPYDSAEVIVDETEILDVINEPVYCLEVDRKEHNFPLAAGVFVKNCEGLSPLGSIKAARTAKEVKYCGCLALRGKVLDVSDCSTDKMMDNKEFFTMFSVLGVGIDAHSVIKDAGTPEEAYQILQKKSRYGKLCIATDSDEDGLAIQKGILYCIAKFARFLIDFGMVWVAESPIFSQGGKYFYPSDARISGTQFCVGMDPKKPFKRYKGLGSLDQPDVYKSFYDPTTRRFIQVTADYIDYAMGLVESIDNRKKLLFDKGILSNPYNFTDL